jgi:predicted metal-dependent hydrolase
MTGRKPRRLVLACGQVDVAVRESPRARRLRLVVGARGDVEVVVPRRTAERAVDEFLARQRAWLERQLDWRPALGLDRPGVVWLDGRALPVVRSGGTRARLRGGALHVPPAGAAEAVERWYRREARSRLEAIVAREQAALGVRAARIAVRDTSSRWGSCSSAGTLSFSWRLVLAPPAVLDYVAVHELCHVREAHHGRAFWALVESRRPGFREPRRWLRDHGRELLAYVPDV